MLCAMHEQACDLRVQYRQQPETSCMACQLSSRHGNVKIHRRTNLTTQRLLFHTSAKQSERCMHVQQLSAHIRRVLTLVSRRRQPKMAPAVHNVKGQAVFPHTFDSTIHPPHAQHNCACHPFITQ